MTEPFFTYFGGKFRSAPHYPRPLYRTIVEPFAGAAGYALRYKGLDVILVEKNPTIAALWRYLITVSEKEILMLPDVAEGIDVHTLSICSEAQSLIGFWLNKGNSSPCNIPSAWMRAGTHDTSFWGKTIRQRIARQLRLIRHWTIIEGDYSLAPDVEATWFIDPPYEIAGRAYRYSSKDIDYQHLATFAQTRKGQVVVCENSGATWLPFIPFAHTKSAHGTSNEVIWESPGCSLFD